jgi:hypothetical protein
MLSNPEKEDRLVEAFEQCAEGLADLNKIAAHTLGMGRSLLKCFISANVADSNGEPANPVDMLHMIGLAFVHHNQMQHSIAEAIREHAQQIGRLVDAVQARTPAPA